MDSNVEQKNRVAEMKTSISSVVHEPIQAKMWCFIRHWMRGHAASCPASSGANRGGKSARRRVSGLPALHCMHLAHIWSHFSRDNATAPSLASTSSVCDAEVCFPQSVPTHPRQVVGPTGSTTSIIVRCWYPTGKSRPGHTQMASAVYLPTASDLSRASSDTRRAGP